MAITIIETPSVTVHGNVRIGTPRLQNGQIVIPDNHVGIEISNIENIPDLTVRIGADTTINLPDEVTNFGVSASAEKKWENPNSTIILQGGFKLDYNTENHKKSEFWGISAGFEF